jgi:hypothetical protein
MTTPAIPTVKQGGSRFYVHPLTDQKAVGVTSVLNMLPKEFLKFWAAKVTAETAVDQLGAVTNLVINGDREGAVDYLKRAHTRSVGGSANVGTEVHELAELMSRGLPIPPVHPDLQPYVDHFSEFLDIFQPEFLHIEETVWSETHGYAGSFDAIARIGNELVIIDNKTTRSGVHAEVALQLSAYERADYILRPDGTQVPIPELDAAAVLHLRPEGWKLVPVQTSDEAFAVFLALKEVMEWDKRLSKAVIGKPIRHEELAS